MSDDYESLPEHIPFSNHLIAGALAGIMEHSLMYPVDNIKTRIQAAHHSAHPHHSSNLNQSLINSVKRISSTEGLKSLWKGISAVILGAGPAHAVYFGVYEFFKTNLIDTHNSPSSDYASPYLNHGIFNTDFAYYAKIAMAGGLATAASEALMNPFDTIKQRMQLNSSLKNTKAYNANYSTIFTTTRHIYAKEGIKSFYYSYPTTLLMTVPFHSTNFLVYETMTKLLNPNNNYNPLVHCVSGGLAGGLASAITTPFDCVKTVLQTHNFTAAAAAASSASSSSSSYSHHHLHHPHYPANNLAKVIAYATNHESSSSWLQSWSRNLHHKSSTSSPAKSAAVASSSSSSAAGAAAAAASGAASATGSKSAAKVATANINNFLSASKYIYDKYGIMGFTRGMKARVISNIPATAISWTSYEMAKFYLNRQYGPSPSGGVEKDIILS